MKRPTDEQITAARLVLEMQLNDDCSAVAVWLAYIQRERWLRQEARRTNMTTEEFRRVVDEILAKRKK